MKVVIGITGASGAIYARELIRFLLEKETQVEVVASDNARIVWADELGEKLSDLPVTVYGLKNFKAPFASGSARYDQMVIVPCSMGTLGRIANGTSNDLISRSADVFLKERRKLIIVPRETPYNLIHLENMKTVLLAGGIVLPATPSFYSKPQTIIELARTVVARILDQMGIENDLSKRYEGKIETIC